MVYNILDIKRLRWSFEKYEDLITFYRSIENSFYKENNIYTETHHILLRCLGGENTKDNLIELPWMIHILAHFLLAKQLETVDKQASIKNFYAVRMILNQDKVENIEKLKRIAEVKAIELETKNKLNCKKIYIKKDGEKTIQIFEEDFPEYEKLGWQKGRNFKNGKGKVFVNDGVRSYQIPKDELSSYLEKGFMKGMFKTSAMKEYDRGKSLPNTKGFKWVNKNGERLLVDPKDLQSYLNDGWLEGSANQPMLGKKNPHSVETRRKLSESNKGKKKSAEHRKKLSEVAKEFHWFTNGKENVRAKVCPEGFVKGRSL